MTSVPPAASAPSVASHPAALRAYLAAPERSAELLDELRFSGARLVKQYGHLVLAENAPLQPAWAQNVWLAPEHLALRSISDGAAQLKQRLRNWALLPTAAHRRAELIQQALPHVSHKPIAFGSPPPKAPLGSFTLLDPALMLVSAPCASPFPNGQLSFVEERTGPPNRAYLKLWELFTITGMLPKPGEVCLDLGSSPGGWSYVLAKLGANVLSVDKAPLDPRVASLKNVSFTQESAFGLDPRKHPPVDWLFSDVICYPARLFTLVQRWLDADKAKNFVCTLKFQAATDHETAARFAAIPGSRLWHLSHNRHELTWWRFSDS